MTEIRQILNSSAIELANKLDAQDSGGKDEKIEASVWNKFVKDKGGKTIQSSITIENAKKSITTYLCNAAKQAGRSVADVAKSWGASGTQADTAVDETNNDDSATRSAGGNKGNRNAKFSTESIKVTVPPAYMSEEAKKIIQNQQEGVRLRESLRKGNTIGITKDNVALAVINVNFGPNSQNQARFIFNKLQQRLDEVVFGLVTTESAFMKLSSKEKNKWIQDAAKKIIQKEKEIVKEANSYKVHFNKNKTKIQQCFDNANKALVDAANNKSSLKINCNEAKLPDGRWIVVYHDQTGEIWAIEIGYDSTPDHHGDGSTSDECEVAYEKDCACYNIDHSNGTTDGRIKSGYNFEKLKEIAEYIFS